jgi:hypothetical protein
VEELEMRTDLGKGVNVSRQSVVLGGVSRPGDGA